VIILYVYLAIGVCFVLATMRPRCRALATLNDGKIPKHPLYLLGAVFGLTIAVVVWPILATDMALTPETYDWGDE